MKKLYYKHRKLNQSRNWNLNRLYRQNKKKGNNNKQNEKRQISKKTRWNDVKHNRWHANARWNMERKREKLSRKTGGHIYGHKIRFKKRVPGFMAASKLNNNTLRTSLHSGIDHPLSFMYNEMQRQHKIAGSRRHKYIRRMKKPLLGPRFKVTTRIGNLHHMNVGNPLFDGIDDLTEGSLVTK